MEGENGLPKVVLNLSICTVSHVCPEGERKTEKRDAYTTWESGQHLSEML